MASAYTLFERVLFFCLTIEAYLSHSYATNIATYCNIILPKKITPRLRNEWIETTNKNGLKQETSYWTYTGLTMNKTGCAVGLKRRPFRKETRLHELVPQLKTSWVSFTCG